ncbi:MAG: phosphate/phosphite/phosphonate ABC transporter substrate-binding protein [Crocinitomicaceae bacterium]
MKKISAVQRFFLCFIFVFVLFACNRKDEAVDYRPEFAANTSGTKILIWGFPSYTYCESAELIVRYLNKHLTGVKIVIKACTSWDEYLQYLNDNKFDITMVNGIEALDATKHGYSIFGKIKDDSQFSTVIFSRKDANIQAVSDLKGEKIALVPSNMIPGTMMPLLFLFEKGLNVNKDIEIFPVSSFESTILSTYLNKSKAGLCMKRKWDVYVRDHPTMLDKIELKWETPALINNALLIKANTDREIVAELSSLFFQIHDSKEGRLGLEQLEISGFETADSETYVPMLDFKKRYDAVIHIINPSK